ncbi:MAG: prepilin-type N-terminal cleavage/methylation domain-containing protein [Candidatus Omnitrophica bacterium]|nr:prepilin-type N-terminal cleavage/methylation domain-containing protein [Candidatus Omnitrophota bacterium]
MTSLIGSKYILPLIKRAANRRGLSFIEVMVAVVIIAGGLVVVIKSFLVSLDRMSYLTNRIYAFENLENRLASYEKILRIYNALPFELEQAETLQTGAKHIDFKQHCDLHAVDDFPDLFQIGLTESWLEGGVSKNISQTRYIANFGNNTP